MKYLLKESSKGNTLPNLMNLDIQTSNRYSGMIFQRHYYYTVLEYRFVKFVLSTLSLQSMQNLSPLVCKVYFMDGKTKAVSVMPCDTTTEVLENVARRIGLKSVEGWALYEVSVRRVCPFVCVCPSKGA